jgi:ribosomal protein L24E
MWQYLALAAAGYLVYKLVKAGQPAVPEKKPGSQAPAKGQEPAAADEMVQDPYCGAYFPKAQGVPARVDGQRLLFCSERCRDGYLKRYEPHDKPRE